MNDQTFVTHPNKLSRATLQARYDAAMASIEQEQRKREAAGYAIGAMFNQIAAATDPKSSLGCAACAAKAFCALFAVAAPIYFLWQMV